MVVVLRIFFFFYKTRIIILWFIDLDIEIVFENEFFPYYIFRIYLLVQHINHTKCARTLHSEYIKINYNVIMQNVMFHQLDLLFIWYTNMHTQKKKTSIKVKGAVKLMTAGTYSQINQRIFKINLFWFFWEIF